MTVTKKIIAGMIITSFIHVANAGCQRPRRGALVLDAGSISIGSCMRLAAGGRVCVYGSGMLSGCTESCAYASFPDVENVLNACAYNISGIVTDLETGAPIVGKEVSLIMPTRHRYVTKSDSAGKFRIRVAPDKYKSAAVPVKVDVDFGSMETVPDNDGIILVGQVTEAFRRAHPDIRCKWVLVGDFEGVTD